MKPSTKKQIRRWENKGGNPSGQENAPSAVLIDIGNTKTALGYVKNGSIIKTWKLTTHKHLQADEYLAKYAHFLQDIHIDLEQEKICIASVVPHITEELKTKKHLELHFINHQSPIDFTISRIHPSHLGADIIAATQAAIKKYTLPIVVIDAGTATTITAIDENAQFLGGAICPGMGISADALYHHASALSPIELTHASKIIGNSTESALLSGITVSHAKMIHAMTDAMIDEAHFTNPQRILTGGVMELLNPLFPQGYTLDPNLTLEGIFEIAKKVYL